MGSLMSGWGSKSATLKRTGSLTKEEIDAYWKSKKEIEDDHLRAISDLSETIQANKDNGAEKKLLRSISMPLASLKESLGTNLEHHIIEKNDWWTKSSWAFLNEPPVTEAASQNKYASQFHVANMESSKNARISA
ncbi:hypothetical protein TanjilG_08196 [Lupinus angustifolius]|uniref:Uncharacterized protein n=1 Tax=Lupinus angustifolius TaxID=3871 RepID=A0A1J7HSI3_LUPAN|nr:PREDICTED: uncharacterized protein LOC109342541 isoform X2 [Lupinus angustifolius]OIW15620.1 hypothetical protein TanjilG_08196 [Lupinus angustifolius]